MSLSSFQSIGIRLSQPKATFVSGDEVRGSVLMTALQDQPKDQQIQAINIQFVGRLSVEVRSRSASLKKTNTAQKVLFRRIQTLWEGRYLPHGRRTLDFRFTFPDTDHPLPSYSNGESQMLIVSKGLVEYFLEVSFLGATGSKSLTRLDLNFIPSRTADRPDHVPIKLPADFTCRASKVGAERGTSLRDKLRPSSMSLDAKVHFKANFVHSGQAIVGEVLHLFLDLIPDPNLTTAYAVPPVHLKALKVVLVTNHTLSTNSEVSESNGTPTKWTWKSETDMVRFRTTDASRMILLYDKIDFRPHFAELRVPLDTLPTITHKNISASHHLEIQAEFDCLGKVSKTDCLISEPIKLLSWHLRREGASPQMQDVETLHSTEDLCPVCEKTLPTSRGAARYAHLDACRAVDTQVEIPQVPMSILMVDDYNDFTSPLFVAYMAHLRQKNRSFARCVGRIVWAEHEDCDVLELSHSRAELQKLLQGKGISWTRSPNHHYWEAEDLHSYDYILYAGQNVERIRTKLENTPAAWQTNPSNAEYRRATLVNLQSFVSPTKWPHDSWDMETAWTRGSSTPEERLLHQFEVIADCCLGFAWQYFRFVLPAPPSTLPVELPTVLERFAVELPADVHPQELEDSQSPLSKRTSQGSSSFRNRNDHEAYNRKSSSQISPVKLFHGDEAYEAVSPIPPNVFELP